MRRLSRQRAPAVAGAAGILATFAAMVALNDAARIGAIALVPWVGLLGIELGPLGGVVAGLAAEGIYLVAVAVDGGSIGVVSLSVRAAALVVVGGAAGVAQQRLAAGARARQTVNAQQTALIDSTLDGICLTDRHGNVLISNAPLRRIGVELGLPPTGTVPERLLALSDRMTDPGRYRERMRALATDPRATSVDEFE
ncbi:MAG: hypothetical protein ACRDLK_06365, partial [Gaiellaceae bacterium]